MLRNHEDVRKNQIERTELVKEAVVWQGRVQAYIEDDNTNLLNSSLQHLSEVELYLYQANKAYDEYFDRMVNLPSIPKKKLWQKLLRK